MLRPTTGSRLSGSTGNNAFAYEQRTRIDPDPQLRLPELKEISSISDIKLGTLPTFSELNDKGNIQTYTGLEHIYHLSFCTDAVSCIPTDIFRTDAFPKNSVPIYIFDNHNYALYFWAEQYAKDMYPATVIHIDQHSDLGIPSSLLPISIDRHHDLPTVAHYTTHICNVGNFIHPAREAGIISECIWIKNQYNLEQLIRSQNKQTPGSYILDIDLDFRAPEMGTDLAVTIPLVQNLMQKASLVTLASSPFFLDQQLALNILGSLVPHHDTV